VFLLAGNVYSQIPEPDLRFSIDLAEVGRAYDEMKLFPETAWDTIPPFDYSTFRLGPRHRVPHFLESDFRRTKTDVNYGVAEGARFSYTYPSAYRFDLREVSSGAFYTYEPRDVSIPGLKIDIKSMDEVAEQVRMASFRETWREAVVTSVTSQRRGTGERRAGLISVDIPLPMPSQLESIFGPGDKTHIDISGREEITFAGESRRIEPFIGVEGQQKQSLFPQLDMEQKLSVTLSGTIGDKVFVQVDHSSEQTLDNNNKVQLWYEGYEDDVIKRVDLGNTNLSLSGSNLISFSSASTGLFGVKVLAEIGSTEMTVIASKQEGETSGASFSPTSGGLGQTERRTIRDIDYIRDKYFWLNDPKSFALPADEANFNIDVWVEINPGDKLAQPDLDWMPGKAFYDPNGDGAAINTAAQEILAGQKPTAPFVKQDFKRLLEGRDYSFIQDFDTKEVLGIVLTQRVAEDKALAINYVTTEDAVNAPGSPFVIGGPYSQYRIPLGTGGAERDTMMLELLKAKNPRSTGEFGAVWNFMMRNFYNLGLTFIDPDNFELSINDNTPRLDTSAPTGSTIPYIQIFGLDQVDGVTNSPGHDGRIDAPSVYLNTTTGILQFPALNAFAPPHDSVEIWTDGGFSFLADSTTRAQYAKSDTMYTGYLTNPLVEAYQYDIIVEAVSTTKTFRIDALNIIENSEKVTIDGTSLSRGTDYDINYDTGEVELKGNALDRMGPDSKVNIDYEYTPFGGGASSSLVGFSTTSKFSQNARLGTIFLYESKGTSVEKPRLGEEPTRALVGGINGQFQHTSRFLTGLANVLPLVDTDAPSVIAVNGEIAASIPDPNTKGEAYIEDFEGIEDSDRISTSRRGWYPASPPVDPANTNDALLPDNRAEIFWYNIEPSYGLHRRDLNPNLNERENNLVSTLDFEVDTKPGAPTEPVWAGVMTGFGGGGLDLSRGQFLEIWVNDFKDDPAERGGRVRIDLGVIDEDFYEPTKNEWNNEDRDNDGFNACIDDTGLDQRHNALPDCVKNFPANDSTEVGPPDAGSPDVDVNGDDYLPQRIDGRFSKVNGTERNGVLDTEDLDRNNDLNEDNSYFSFVIDLSDEAVVDIRKEFPHYEGFDEEGHTRDAWRLYRVKITEAEIINPTGIPPSLDQVRHARVWIEDVDSVFHFDSNEDGRGRFQFAELKIVGNRWELDGVRDLDDNLVADSVYTSTEFQIGPISTKTDPTRYNPPIVPREENGVFDKEQSMFLKYDSLEAGRSIRIFKQFVGKGLDLTSYRDLNFWVHADPVDLPPDTTFPHLKYYMRLAFDENNFYEIQIPITQKYFDPASGWADVRIRIEDLTGLKFAQSDSVFQVRATVRDIVQTSRRYEVRLKNRPNMFDIRFLYAGLRNPSGQVFVAGEVWLNDIYAGAVRRDIGIAQRLGANVNIGGGVLSIGGNWQRTDADFRGLRARRGSGVANESVSLNAKTRVEHFIPLLGFSIPLSATYSKSTALPRYTPNGDTEISSEAVRDSMRSETTTKTFSTSLAKKGSQNPLLKYTVDKTTTSFSFSEQMRRSPTSRDTSRTMTGSLNYQINWSKKREIPLWRGIRLGYWPKSMNFRIQASRKTARRNRFRSGSFVPDPFFYDAKVNLNGSLNYSPLKSLTSSFNGAMARDLNQPHYRYGVDIGRETSRNHGMQLAWKPPRLFLISEFQPDVSYNSSYRESSGPEVRRPGDPSGTRNSSNQRSVTGKMLVDVGKYFGQVFGFFGWLEDEPAGRKPGQGAQPQPPPAAVPDTSGAAAGDTTVAEPSRPRADPMIAVRKFGGMLKNIRKINVNVQQKFNSRYSRIPERPSLAYQFGMTESSGIIKSQETLDQPDQSTNSLSLIMDSGVQVSQDLDVAARFNSNFTTTSTKGAEAETQSMTWPDISLKWTGLERFSLFRAVFASSSANLLYRKTSRESGRKGAVDSKTESVNLSPSMAFTFKNEINSTLSMSYQSDLTDNRGSITEKSSITISLDLKKDFRGGTGFKLPIPFFSKQVKWSSTLNSNVNIAYSRAGGKRYQEGSELSQPIPLTTSLKVSPNLTYTFSRALNGRFFVDYTRAYAEASDRTTTTLRIGLSAVLNF
jgi:hypothetical protein